MDSVDLLARENEFKKLNRQLERKTESLMKEIEEVMQKPDIFATPNLKLNLYNNRASARKHHCNSTSPLQGSPSPKASNFSNNKTDWRRNSDKNSKIIPNSTSAAEHLKEHRLNNESVESLQCNLNSTDVASVEKVVCDCCVKEKICDDLEFLYAFVSVNVKDNVLPQSFLKGKVTVESVCKCLSAKIKLMQEQLDKLQDTLQKKNKQCEAHLTHTAELESERLSLLNAANNMKCETADMKAKYLAIQNRLNEKDRLYKEQRSATDKLTVEIKQYRSKNSGLEARCASQEETIGTLRQQLEAARLSEKEYRSSTRSLSFTHEATIRRLEAQLSTVRTRMTQHRALVANLRAQRALVSGQREVQALNAQYCRLLEDGE